MDVESPDSVPDPRRSPVRAPTVVVAMALVFAGVLATPAAAVTADPAWSGHVFTGGTFTSISATWTEPTVRCTTYSDLLDIWVGLGGYTDSTVEQAGIVADCSSGAPVYEPFSEFYPAYPAYPSNPVSSGDVVTSTVSTTGNGAYTATIYDHTKGWTKSVHGNGPVGGQSSAEIIVESSADVTFPNFQRLTFSDITVNGKPVTGFTDTALVASDQTGPIDQVGTLTTSGFTVTYLRE
jgi:hypothetical protein